MVCDTKGAAVIAVVAAAAAPGAAGHPVDDRLRGAHGVPVLCPDRSAEHLGHERRREAAVEALLGGAVGSSQSTRATGGKHLDLQGGWERHPGVGVAAHKEAEPWTSTQRWN